MNSELIKQIQADAVTIKKFTDEEMATRRILKMALKDAYREVEPTHEAIDRIMTKNSQTEAAMFNDSSKRLLGLTEQVSELEAQLKDANQRIAELLCEPDKAVEILRDLESVANDNGRKEGESVRDFITRVVCELVTAQTQVSMLQKRAIVYGCNAQESVIDFMARTKTEIQSLQNRLSIIDDAADKNGCGRTEETEEFIARIALERKDLAEQVKDLKAGEAESKAAAEEYGVLTDESHAQFIKRVLGDLATAKEEARRERERGNRINAEAEENMKKLWKCANDLGRTDYEPLWSFMDRQAAEIAGLKKRIDDVITNKTPNEVTKYLYDCADKLGRGTTETIADFMRRQNEALDRQTNHISESAKSLELARQSLHDKGHALLKMSAWHEQNLQKIQELEGDSKRKDQTVARLQKVLNAIHGAAKAGGLKQGEKIGAFIERLNEELYKVRGDATSESLKMGNANKQLQRSYDESRLWAAEELKTARAESLRARTELSKIAKIVNPEGENGPVIEFVRDISNQLTVSHKLHSAAVEERNNAQEEVRKLSAELGLVTKQLQNGQVCWDTYGQLCKFATSCGMTGDESVKQFIERKIVEASTVTADRDRIRAELAAILAEANKSGRCSGDPVALIRQGQADLDALTHYEKDNAELDALVSQLQGELAEARDQAGVANHECSIWNNAAARAGQTLAKMGKLQDETEAQFIERMNRHELDRSEQLKNALAAKMKAESDDKESHRRFMNLIRLADSCGRLHGESVERFVARSEQLRISNMEQRDEARAEVDRLSELVAALQVDLDEAKGQYSGIMVQLGNETPLQLIERMQRLSQDQRASTIPHDERAALVGEIADLRKRLEAKTAEHAKLDYYVNCVRMCASHHGLRKGEELKSFINDKCNELAEAMKTVESQSAAISEAQKATEKYTEVVQAAAKLRDWASTIRHKVLVPMVHTKAMTEYDNIMKELDGKAGTDGR